MKAQARHQLQDEMKIAPPVDPAQRHSADYWRARVMHEHGLAWAEASEVAHRLSYWFRRHDRGGTL